MTIVLERPAVRVPITGKAAIYTRISGSRQEEGASLGVQRDACLRFCQDRGLVVIREFRDVWSGLDADRPEYVKAVELAQANGFDKLVVWRLDRLGRDSAEYIPLLKGLKRIGVDVVSVTQPTESMFMQQVIGVMAEEESRQISIRTTASKQRRYKEGYWGGNPPFGYDSVKAQGGSVLQPNKDAPIVTELFNRYASGKHSLADLRDYLNERGHLMSKFGINRLLKNSAYIGMVRHGMFSRSPFHPKPEPSEVKGKHPPLTTRPVFDMVQWRLAQNIHRQRGGTRPKYLFSGLIICGGCGCKFVGRTGHGREGRQWVQYNCGRRSAFGDCKAHSVYETRVRDTVLVPIQKLLDQLSQDDLRAAVREQLIQHQRATIAGTLQTKETLAETQKRLEGRLSRLEDSYLDQEISKERYLLKRDEINAQLEEVKAQLAERPHLALPDTEQLFALVDILEGEPPDDAEWRDIVEGVVEKIVVEGEGDGRKAPATIRVVWKGAFVTLLGDGGGQDHRPDHSDTPSTSSPS